VLTAGSARRLARRAVVLLGLTVGLLVIAIGPASASFTDVVRAPTTVGTMSVTAPSTVAVSDTCWGIHHSATISWSASTTPRGVTGYRVMVYFNDGSSSLVSETDAATRSITATSDTSVMALQPRITVTTLTSYGWSTESAPSGVLAC
jgi:hypothetical protein